MPHGADWTSYPWTGVSINYDYNTTWAGSSAVSFPMTTYYHTGGSTYPHYWPPAQQIAEKVESAMDWLRRRVTEITDLAYEGV